MKLVEFKLSFSSFNDNISANPLMIAWIKPIASGTRIFFSGSDENYIDVKETYEEVLLCLSHI